MFDEELATGGLQLAPPTSLTSFACTVFERIVKDANAGSEWLPQWALMSYSSFIAMNTACEIRQQVLPGLQTG